MKKIVQYLLIQLFYIGFVQAQVYPERVTVARDGSGDFTSIQEAINSVRDLGHRPVTIYIKAGVYQEKIVIPSWKTNLKIIGEEVASTIVTGNDYSGKPLSQVPGDFGENKFSTYTSYTMLVQANDIEIENLTIQNTAGRVGQAVALHVEGDRIKVWNCRLLGNQDTLYVARDGSRQYYKGCYIEGTVDFIFGEATAVFQHCTIKSLSDGYVTAAATRPGQTYGFVFLDCTLIGAKGVSKVFLGRPWRPYAKTVFIRGKLGGHILPEGWDPWEGDEMFPDKERTTYYAEYLSQAESSTHVERVAWAHQLKKKQLKRYTLSAIFGSANKWYFSDANL